MIAMGLFYIGMMVLSGILTLTCLILAIIKYSNSSKGAGWWLTGFIVGLIALFLSVALFTRGIINKTKEMVDNISSISDSDLDSLGNYLLGNDSLVYSEQVKYLMTLEQEEHKGNLPNTFYTYLGFKDYYRLPLRYPFSLHCMDSLGNAELFNEEHVQEFDVNDNGEIDCDVKGITEFQFNADYLIGRSNEWNGKKGTSKFFLFNFVTKDKKEFKTLRELNAFLESKGIVMSKDLYSCQSYYSLL